MATIKNLTPHALVLVVEDETGPVSGGVGFGRAAREAQFRVVAEMPSEGVARATTSVEEVGRVEVNGESLPVTKTIFGGTADQARREPDHRLRRQGGGPVHRRPAGRR